MRRFRELRTRTIILLLVFLIAGGISAAEILDGEICHVEPDEVVTGDLFVFCGTLRIEGRVEGNVLGAARTTTVTGEVEGGLYIIGGELNFDGQLGKDLHFAGLILNVLENGQFAHERSGIISLNLSNTIRTKVPGSIANLGYQLIVNGDIDGEVNFWGSALTVGGMVEGDVNATVGNANSDGASSQIQTLLIPFPFEVDLVDPGLVLLEDARIEGQLDYRGPTTGVFERSQLANAPIYRPTGRAIFDPDVPTSAANLQRYFSSLMREFATLAFVSLVFLLIIPRQMQSPLRYMQTRPLSTLGVGMLSFIMSFPIVLVLALFSIFIIFILSLLPINTVVVFSGVVLGLANIGLASVFYFTAIYVARVVFALALGRLMLRLANRYDGSTLSLFFSLMIGNLLLAFASTFPLPLIGWGINAFAAFLGLGAILTLLQAKIKAFLESAPSTPRAQPAYATTQGTVPQKTRRLPFRSEQSGIYSSSLGSDQAQIGMENLPDGFDWWGESEE